MDQARVNATLARWLWDATSAGDGGALRSLLHERVVWRTRGHHPRAGEVRGIDAVIEHMARAGDGVDEMRLDLREIHSDASGAIAIFDVYARRGPKVLDASYLLVYRMQAGRVTELETVPTDPRADDIFWALE